MLTGKEKRYLRSMAHNFSALFQVGKEGMSYNLINDILNYLNKHELLKVSVLKNCDTPMEKIVKEFEHYDIEVAQVIGRTLVLYKQSDNAIDPIKF